MRRQSPLSGTARRACHPPSWRKICAHRSQYSRENGHHPTPFHRGQSVARSLRRVKGCDRNPGSIGRRRGIQRAFATPDMHMEHRLRRGARFAIPHRTGAPMPVSNDVAPPSSARSSSSSRGRRWFPHRGDEPASDDVRGAAVVYADAAIRVALVLGFRGQRFSRSPDPRHLARLPHPLGLTRAVRLWAQKRRLPCVHQEVPRWNSSVMAAPVAQVAPPLLDELPQPEANRADRSGVALAGHAAPPVAGTETSSGARPGRAESRIKPATVAITVARELPSGRSPNQLLD